ncbi:hypothetical protein BDV18DRAFT_162176 [Aspergillus unguis]
MSIFVCGATGTQGFALTTHLLARNVKVRSISRDLSTSRSKAALASGVILSQGDFNDESALHAAMAGCTGLFLNLVPDISASGQELNQARRILSVAKQAGIKHVVYSSGLVTHPERRKYWDETHPVAKMIRSKNAVEEAVRGAGFEAYTILRPGDFMSNYVAPRVCAMYPGLVERGELVTALDSRTVLPVVDPDDIGRAGAAVFMQPGRFNGREIALVGEMMTVEDMLRELSSATGRELTVHYMTNGEVEAQRTNPVVGAQLMMRDMSDEVDMQAVRAWGVELGELGGFAAFLHRDGGDLLSPNP